MGAESPRNIEPNNNNVFVPNLLAKEIIGDIDTQKNGGNNAGINFNKNKNEQGTIVNEKNSNNEINNNNYYNNIYLNRNDDFAILNNENIYNENEIITNVNRRQHNRNEFVASTAEAIKMEITNRKQGLDYRKYKFNGITVVQNLRDYVPKNITKEEIKDMIFNALADGLVDDDKYYIPGKTVTLAQATAIVDLIENYIKDDSSVEKLENKSLLKGVNLTIDLVDLNKDIIKKKMFKGKNPSEIEVENILKNLSQGMDNIKVLSIEFN
jgi:cell division protein ZapA (FtsZ GTPase activity inhibitor)